MAETGSSDTRCPICKGQREPTHKSLILNRHEVTYYKCFACEFWGTQTPFWLEEAYGNAIAVTDTGLVTRNLRLAKRITLLLRRLSASNPGIFVDWAGGHGLFVRLMRDQGFDFHWQDDYAENILAKPHIFARTQVPVSAVTAFEVFEHVADPLSFVENILNETGSTSIIFTTQLHRRSYDPSWWYLAPEAGQHISFYTELTLRTIANKYGLRLHSHAGIHMFTDQKIHPRAYAFTIQASPWCAPLLAKRQRSLTQPDHDAAVAVLRASGQEA